MKGRRRKITDGDAKTLGSQIPGLSLFIILLAFFIVLNSISVYQEDKATSLMESVERAFSTKITERENWQPSSIPSDDEQVREGRTTDRIEAVFSSRISGLETQMDDTTGTLLLRMPYDDFKKSVNNAVEGGGTVDPLVRTLVSILRADMSGYPYRMDVYVQVDKNPASMQNREPQKISTLLTELGEIGAVLGRAGLPEKLMTVGIEEGEEGMVELLFKPHVPYNPLHESRTSEE
ncbi:MAG: flagellar motor protein MotB [Micavibrio sp.]